MTYLLFQDDESGFDQGIVLKPKPGAWDPYMDKATFFRDDKRKIGKSHGWYRMISFTLNYTICDYGI